MIRNNADLYEAWNTATVKAVVPKDKSNSKNIIPTMTTVDPATAFFRSFSRIGATEMPKSPNIKIEKTSHQFSRHPVGKLGKQKIENIPAMTSVHECNKLETGVGPSIASGSHNHVTELTDLNTETSANMAKIEVA